MTATSQSDATGRQFMRFVIIGVINTAFGVGLYSFLVLIGLAPQPALALAFVIGVLWNFMLHGRFVFASRGLSRLPHYALAYVVTYVFNATALHGLLAAGAGEIIAQIILAPFAAVLSFILVSRALTGQFPALPSRRAG